MTTDPNDPTTPLPPQEPVPAEPGEPARPSAPPQPVQPAAPPPGTPVQPVQPVEPVRPVDPPEDRPRIDVGRFVGGALAAIVVSALVAWVLHFVLTDLAGLTVLAPPDAVGIGDDSVMGERNAYAIDTALVALLAAIVLALLAATPRPRLFFGWIMVLLAIIAVAVPLSRSSDMQDGIVTAVLNLVIVAAIWSLLGGVAGRAIRPENLTPART